MDTRDLFTERVAEMARLGQLQPACLAMSRTIIREKAALCGATLPGVAVYYALKANDDPEVARIVAEAGLGFEVGSIAELNSILHLGVPPGKIISSNPIKAPEFINFAFNRGVRTFAFDSRAEVDKLVKLAPGCEAVVRLAVPNVGSEWPLSGKFGVEWGPAVELLAYAKVKGLNAVGVNFHVGSQCMNLAAWDTALGLTAKLFEEAKDIGLEFDLINLGGGYPSRYLKPIPSVGDIESVINKSLAHWFPGGVRLMIEPGRFLVGEAGVFVTRVIGKAQRQDGLWIMIDVGVFNGMAEALGGIRYEYLTLRDGPRKVCIMAGPSCDGFDVIDKEAELIEPEVGDIVLIRTAGAYTTVYAARFNGFPLPAVKLVEDSGVVSRES
jgi:ornithine decarboxylase